VGDLVVILVFGCHCDFAVLPVRYIVSALIRHINKVRHTALKDTHLEFDVFEIKINENDIGNRGSCLLVIFSCLLFLKYSLRSSRTRFMRLVLNYASITEGY